MRSLALCRRPTRPRRKSYVQEARDEAATKEMNMSEKFLRHGRESDVCRAITQVASRMAADGAGLRTSVQALTEAINAVLEDACIDPTNFVQDIKPYVHGQHGLQAGPQVSAAPPLGQAVSPVRRSCA